MYGVELLSSNDSIDHVMTTSDIERMEHLGLAGECKTIGEVDNGQYLKNMLVSSVLHELNTLMLRFQDLINKFNVIVAEVDRIRVCILDLHLLLDKPLRNNHKLSTLMEGENM